MSEEKSMMVIATKYKLPILDGKVQIGSKGYPQEQHRDVPVEREMVKMVNANSPDNGIMWEIDEKKTAEYLKIREKRIAEKRDRKAKNEAAKKGAIEAIAEVVSQEAKKKADKEKKAPAKPGDKK
jgi:hypothetical protein